MSPINKRELRRAKNRQEAAALLKAMAQGSQDSFECYRALYALWCSNNAAVRELRPLFRLPGIDPGGSFSVSNAFRDEVKSLATQILPLFSSAKVDAQ